ncbi:glycoside hydrolase family 36 N-terminal domain-containing protein, partial [Vibrio sp. 10N.222.54.F6]
FNAPGIEGHREGLDWAPVFKTVRYDAQDQEVSFLLEDKVTLLEIKVEIKLDFESDVVQKRVTVINKGSNKYYLNKLSSTLPLPNHANELMTFHGRWCHEF